MKYSVTLIVLLLSIFRSVLSIQAQDNPGDMIKQFVNEVYNTGNVALVDDMFASNYTRYPETTNREDFKRTVLGLRAAMPDFYATPVIVIEDSNLVALHLRMEGTLVSELVFPDSVPIPAAGQHITMAANIIYRLDENGQVIEEWDGFDNLSFLAQIDALPMPPKLWNGPFNIVETSGGGLIEQHQATVESYFNALQRNDFSSIGLLLHEHFIGYNPFGSFDRDGFIDDWRALRNALPDFALTLESISIEGNIVAARYVLRGTFGASFQLSDGSTAMPTGNAIELMFITFFQIDESQRIVEIRELYDGFSFLVQLGVMHD